MPLATLTVMPNTEDAGLPLVASLLKRVLDSSDAIKDTVASLSSKLDRIEVQVNKTNGRVLVLEDRADEIEQWRDGVQSEDEQAAYYAAGRQSKDTEHEERVGRVKKAILGPIGKGVAAFLLVVGGYLGERVIEVFR
jgi:hypothetical protein